MEDIRLLNPHRNYSTGSKPTEIQINRMMIQQFERINGVLDVLGYQTPVPSNVTGIHVLARLSSTYVAAMADGAQLSVGNQPANNSESLMRQYTIEWADFTRGKVSIKGVTRKGVYTPKMNENKAESHFQSKSDSDSSERDPIFNEDTKW
jgi:hypothetical protein